MLDLINTTEDSHYEAYRSQQMETRKPGEAKGRKQDNPKFKEEEEALRKRFTEQVKQEEVRFRQWEKHVSRCHFFCARTMRLTRAAAHRRARPPQQGPRDGPQLDQVARGRARQPAGRVRPRHRPPINASRASVGRASLWKNSLYCYTLDVRHLPCSLVRQLPPGRLAVHSFVCGSALRNRTWDLGHCVCAPYPRMPSAKDHCVSSAFASVISTPRSVTVAIWYCGASCVSTCEPQSGHAGMTLFMLRASR
jgi:hypothetical protein